MSVGEKNVSLIDLFITNFLISVYCVCDSNGD